MFILSRKPKKNRRIQWGISKVENQRTTGGYKGVIESRKPKNNWELSSVNQSLSIIWCALVRKTNKKKQTNEV
jgi:hypothetical protein